MKRHHKKSKSTSSHASLIIGGFALVILVVLLVFPQAKFASATSCATGFSAVGSTCVEYLTNTAVTSFTVPTAWSNTNNTIEVIGGGGGGGGSYGGGGGAYTISTNVSLPNSTGAINVTYKIGAKGTGSSSSGAAGGDTYFCNSTSTCTGVATTNVVAGAKGGSGGTRSAGGAGGVSSSGKATGTGSAKYSGGNGGSSLPSGGGGAAGPNGAGVAADFSGDGGYGDNGLGGAGGSSGSAGSAGQEYDSSHGSGGGGGGSFGVAGTGGNYGAGGGGNDGGTGAAGAQGLIILSYTPTVVVTKPTVTTNTPPSSITSSSAALDGQITATGGANATQSGFALGTDSTLSNINIIGTSTLGGQTGTASFEDDSLATSLSPSTTYYYRAYATNSGGTGYGSIQNFTTNAPAAPTSITPESFTVAQNGPEVVDLSNSPSGTGFLLECPSASDIGGESDSNDCYYGTDGNQYVDDQFASGDGSYDFTMYSTGSYFFALYSYEGETIVPIAESDIVTVTGSGSSASVSPEFSDIVQGQTGNVDVSNSPENDGMYLLACPSSTDTGGSSDPDDCLYSGQYDESNSQIIYDDGTYPTVMDQAGTYFFALYAQEGETYSAVGQSGDVTVTGGSSGGYTVGTPGSQDMLIHHFVAMPGSIGTGAGGGFVVSPSRVRKGSSTQVQFSWSMQNEQSCGIAGSDGSTPLANTGAGMLINGIAATTGGNYTQPYSVSINAPTTYTLTCTDGTTPQSVEVQINLVPSYQEI